MSGLPGSAVVGVVGAGAMGAGIAQVAAVHGHPVRLFDAVPGAAEAARDRLARSLETRVARGRIDSAEAAALLARITPVPALERVADAALVIEAVVEDPQVKRSVFQDLEAVVAPEAYLCSNTSSLSISQLAAGLERPDRVAGLHFFNPAPVMALVEVVSGLATAEATIAVLIDTVRGWGKVPVRARSTPGFIVNRIARPFYGEALALVEQGIPPATIDGLLRRGAGFRMGPCELMDLIGHDVNHAVTRSVHAATYGDPRFRPSLVQQELVDAGWTGQKAGRGFYDHAAGDLPTLAADEVPPGTAPLPGVELGRATEVEGVVVDTSDGRSALQRELDEGVPCLVHDLVGRPDADLVGYACSPSVPTGFGHRFAATLAASGTGAVRLPDLPGLVVLRTVAMIANEAFDAVHLQVADEEEADLAMVHGVNYPEGPLAWGRRLGVGRLLAAIEHLRRETADPRYRVSLRLRQEAQRAVLGQGGTGPSAR